MKSTFEFADDIRVFLNASAAQKVPRLPHPVVIAAFALMNAAGTLSAYPDPVTGALTLTTGLTVSGVTAIGGAITFKSVNTAVAAAGSTNADAAPLTTASLQHVSSDSAAKGVKLPVGVPGYDITIINDSGTACEIYPDAGGNVNGQTTTTGSVTIPASKGVRAICTVALTWNVFDLPAKSS